MKALIFRLVCVAFIMTISLVFFYFYGEEGYKVFHKYIVMSFLLEILIELKKAKR